MISLKDIGVGETPRTIEIDPMINALNEYLEVQKLSSYVGDVESYMETNLEDDNIQVSDINILSETIIALGEKINIDTSLLASDYEDKEIALKMINTEGISVMRKIKDAVSEKLKKTVTAISDLSKRLVNSTKGKSHLDTLENIFKNSIKHNIEFKESDFKFIERTYRSYAHLNKIGSITALVSSLKKETYHIEDVFKTFEVLRDEKLSDASLKEIRDVVWKNMDLNKVDKEGVRYIYDSKDFEKIEINGIKDRSIRPYFGVPYKDTCLVILVGAVDASFTDKVFKIKRLTRKKVLRFDEPADIKNTLAIGVAKDLTGYIHKELQRLEKQITTVQKYSMTNMTKNPNKGLNTTLSDLHLLAFYSILDRYAL